MRPAANASCVPTVISGGGEPRKWRPRPYTSLRPLLFGHRMTGGASELPIENVQIERLDQVMVEACSLRAPAIELLPPAGLSYQEHSHSPGLSSITPAHLVAIHARHAEIEQCNI